MISDEACMFILWMNYGCFLVDGSDWELVGEYGWRFDGLYGVWVHLNISRESSC